MIRALLLPAALALLAAPVALRAQADAPPQRMRALTVYGNDPCPAPVGDEIVVCGREPESERYRIPKRLRKTEETAEGRSWTDRVPVLEEASRAQRPGSCTAIGAGGQTGCTQAMLREWFAARRAAEAGQADVP